jgi:hypothetical protein
MARVDPAGFAEKHNRRLKAALEDMRAGVNRLTTSPTEAAAAKKDKMLARLTEAVNTGKWEAGLRRVTLEEWRRKMIEVGIPRVSAGIDANRDKVVAFAEKLLPHVDAGVAAIKRMPDVTLEDSIARMTAFIRHMAAFKRG